MSRIFAQRSPAHRAEYRLRVRHAWLLEMIRTGQFDKMLTSTTPESVITVNACHLHQLALGESHDALVRAADDPHALR